MAQSDTGALRRCKPRPIPKQVEVHRRRGPITLDFDCAQNLRCPLVSLPHHSLPRALAGAASPAAPIKRSSTSEHSAAAVIGDEENRTETSGCARSSSDVQEGFAKGWTPGGDVEDEDGHRRSCPPSASSNCREHDLYADEHADDLDGMHGHDSDRNVVHAAQPEGGAHMDHLRPQTLVPVRLVAVLIDGAGKGWMAARRLWSVADVGYDVLAEAGLTKGAVDSEQEVSDAHALCLKTLRM